MKILWFTNNAVNFDKSAFGGGWMQCLESRLSAMPNIQLSIATRVNSKVIQKKCLNGTDYYLLPDRRSKLEKRVDLLLGREPTSRWLEDNLRLIEEIDPDVIQVFGTEMDYGLICGNTKAPVVIHLQGILHPYYYQLTRVPISLSERLLAQGVTDYIKGNTLSKGLKIYKNKVEIENRIFNKCRNFIGRTDWDKGIANLFAPEANYFHCDEIISGEYLRAEWLGNNSQPLDIVSTISNPLYKGHDTLIATAEVLHKAGVDFRWHVIGLASNSSSYRFFYSNHLGSLKNKIKLHGRLTSKEIIEILKNAHLYVHPSHIENSSNSICEAMAVGMPVIALHVGGNASMINNDVDGLLVADNDPYILARRILEISSSPNYSRRLGRNAKTRATERHNADAIATSLIDIYKTLIVANGK